MIILNQAYIFVSCNPSQKSVLIFSKWISGDGTLSACLLKLVGFQAGSVYC